jgi:glycosyltransferase involved in cell wall biosynthesis
MLTIKSPFKSGIRAITGGRNVPSARFRIRQLKPYFEMKGIELREYCSITGQYPPKNKFLRTTWIMTSLFESALKTIVMKSSKDPLILQRPFISSTYTIEWLLKNYILDVDDPIWLQFNGRSDIIAKRALAIVCGNEYLFNHYKYINENCFIIPTCVDIKRWCPSLKIPGNVFNVGWSGTSPGLKYLYTIEDQLHDFLEKCPEAILTISCDKPPVFKSLPLNRVIYKPWTPLNEVSVIQSFDVGIMPLNNSLYSRGKCSYKLLLYSAVAIPSLGSPVGMNESLASQGGCILVGDDSEWAQALLALAKNKEQSKKIGLEGRRCIELNYSCEIAVDKWVNIFKFLSQK